MDKHGVYLDRRHFALEVCPECGRWAPLARPLSAGEVLTGSPAAVVPEGTFCVSCAGRLAAGWEGFLAGSLDGPRARKTIEEPEVLDHVTQDDYRALFHLLGLLVQVHEQRDGIPSTVGCRRHRQQLAAAVVRILNLDHLEALGVWALARGRRP